MSSRRQRSIPLGGRYRQVSLYLKKMADILQPKCSNIISRFLLQNQLWLSSLTPFDVVKETNFDRWFLVMLSYCKGTNLMEILQINLWKISRYFKKPHLTMPIATSQPFCSTLSSSSWVFIWKFSCVLYYHFMLFIWYKNILNKSHACHIHYVSLFE